jgi:hypothetical protein
MPKIPTYTAQGRPTTEVGGIRSNIKLDPTRTIASALLPAAKAIDDYHIKQRDNNEKLEARKTFYEMKAESDKIIESYKNNSDEFASVNGYNGEFDVYKNQKLSQIKNKRVKKRLELLLAEDQAENVYNIKKNSFDAFEVNETQTYNDGQNILANEYSLATNQDLKNIKLNKMLDLAAEHGDIHQKGEAWLKEETNKIKANAELFEVDSALARNDFATATNILKSSKSIDNDEVEKRILKMQEQKDVSLYYEGFKTGNDYLVGADEDNADTLKSIEEMSMRENYFNKEGKPKNDAELFLGVDKSFKNVGRLAPSYKQILKQGVLSSPANGVPTPQIVRALRIADAADQSGRLDEYTTGEELKFYRSYLAARRIKGKTESEAYEMAVKSKDVALKLSSLPQYRRKRETTFKEIRKAYSEIKSTNLTEILSYGESLFDLYIGLGSSPDEARKQVTKDLKKDIQVVDDYGYLKRDINPYKSIGGLEEIKPTKEFIINKYLPDEDADDFYLTYTGAGEFAIYNRDVPHTYYNDEGIPMLFTYENMVSFKKEIKIKSKEKEKEKLGEKQESFIEQLKETKPFLKAVP